MKLKGTQTYSIQLSLFLEGFAVLSFMELELRLSLSNFYYAVLPCLLELNIPATCFWAIVVVYSTAIDLDFLGSSGVVLCLWTSMIPKKKGSFLKQQSGALITYWNFSWLVYCSATTHACSKKENKKNSEALFQNQVFSWSYSDGMTLDWDAFYLIIAENLARQHFTVVPKYSCRCSSLITLHIQKCFVEGILVLHLPARQCLREAIAIHTIVASGQCGLKGRITHCLPVPLSLWYPNLLG